MLKQLQKGLKDGPYRACIKLAEIQSMVQMQFTTFRMTTQKCPKSCSRPYRVPDQSGLLLFSVLGKHSGRSQGWWSESACEASTGRGTVYHANTKFPTITC